MPPKSRSVIQPTNNPVTTLADYGVPEVPQVYDDPGAVGDDMDMPDDLALQATLAEIGESGAEAQVRVYQIDQRTKKDVFLYDCSVTEFASAGLSEIQARYGAGDYRIRVYRGGSILTHRRVSIGEPIKPLTDKKATEAPDIVAFMTQQQQAMMTGFKEIIASMQQAPQREAMGVNDVIALIGTLQGLTGNQRQADPLEMITRVLALTKELPGAGGGDGDTGTAVMLKAMETFGPALTEMMALKRTEQQTAHVPLLPNPVPVAPQATAPAAQPVVQPELDEMGLKFEMLKGALFLAAANDYPTDMYVDMALDNFTDEELHAMLDPADWFEQICAKMPNAKDYTAWFGKLRNDILAEMAKPPESDQAATA